jgi:hypothetical protein
MNVVDSLSLGPTRRVEPRVFVVVQSRLLAAVFGPLDVRRLAKNAGLGERPDIHPHAVVQVRLPAEGLLAERLPAREDIVRGGSPARISLSFCCNAWAAPRQRSAPTLSDLLWAVIQSDERAECRRLLELVVKKARRREATPSVAARPR